jgi:hypothetical protein
MQDGGALQFGRCSDNQVWKAKMSMLAGAGQHSMDSESPVHGTRGHIDPTVAVQGSPQDLVSLCIGGIVEVLECGHLAGCHAPLSQQSLEPPPYLWKSALKNVDGGIG